MNESTRSLLFLIGCIGVRSFLVYLAKTLSQKYLNYMAYICLIIGITFIYLYASNSRQTAPEAGGKVWWNNVRPIHGILYLLFAMSVFNHNKKAWIYLLIDVILGLLFYLNHKLKIV